MALIPGSVPGEDVRRRRAACPDAQHARPPQHDEHADPDQRRRHRQRPRLEVRRELDDLRAETTPLIRELHETTDEARATVNEARADLERFDRVLGSAEAIGDAVGGTLARTSFSSPVIKAAGLARGTSRTIARLRGVPRTPIGPVTAQAHEPRNAIETGDVTNRQRRRRRA